MNYCSNLIVNKVSLLTSSSAALYMSGFQFHFSVHEDINAYASSSTLHLPLRNTAEVFNIYIDRFPFIGKRINRRQVHRRLLDVVIFHLLKN